MERRYKDDREEIRFRFEQMWLGIGQIREVARAGKIDLNNDPEFELRLRRLAEDIEKLRGMTFERNREVHVTEEAGNGTKRAREWLEETWPEAEVVAVDVSTGRDSVAWDMYRPGAPPFRVEFTGPLRAHPDTLEKRLEEATSMRRDIEANAPGSAILTSDAVELRPPKE